MAQRAKKTAVRQTRRVGNNSDTKSDDNPAAPTPAAPTSEDRLEQLEHERNEAWRQLAAAEKRIKQLESTQDEVVNRIDWVIDSLHNLTDRKS